ncbi:MAG TPA: type II secretion system inner membrane protein GspF [Thermodesulfobacteriota bacterium]|nr:type II secretion system inner membrane protein GspF [Thermodesulfobacteriota bacterium]
MPIFQYKAYNDTGKEVSGEVEAASNKDAFQILKRDGLYPKELSSLKSERFVFFNLLHRPVSLTKLAITTAQLSTLLASGATLYDALSILINEEENKVLRDVIIRVKERIAEGSSLCVALEDYPEIFPEIYRRMIEAGEASGTLDKVLARLAEYLENRASVQRQVRTALLYPLLMTIVGFGILSFLFVFVIPKITGIFEDTKQTLPLITIILLRIVNLFRNYWPLMLIFMGGGIWGARKFIAKPTGKAFLDRVLLRLPWIGGTLTKFYIASLASTLGSLMESGVPILKALDLSKKALGHAAFDTVLNKAITDITEGVSLSESFKGSNIVPGFLTHMIAIGERSGKLEDLLLRVASTYEKDFETAVTRAISLLEPLLILTMGFVVGFIVLAILLPIFELNQGIR